MGFKRQSKVYRLTFAGEYAGLSVSARSLPLGKFMKMGKLVDVDVANPTGDDFETLEELFSLFLEALVSWNLEEEDGTPVPVTREALYEQDLAFVLMLVVVYMDAVSGVPAPLDGTSPDGGRSLAESLPMEIT